MKLDFPGYAPPINYNLQRPGYMPDVPKVNTCDSVSTSKQALLLSRSLPALQEQLLPRSDVIKKFAADIATPIQLDDPSLERILANLG